MKYLFYIFITLWVPNAKAQVKEPINGLIIFKIDNQAIVRINNDLIYDSGIVEGDPEMNVVIDFDKHQISDNDSLTVECYNSRCFDCEINPWGVMFEVYKNGEQVDYYHEKSNGTSGGGLVYKKCLIWGEY